MTDYSGTTITRGQSTGRHTPEVMVAALNEQNGTNKSFAASPPGTPKKISDRLVQNCGCGKQKGLCSVYVIKLTEVGPGWDTPKSQLFYLHS